MTNIIDRRLNPRDKTIKNRQKFIERSKQQIKKAVKDAINGGNIADIENGKVKVKVRNVDEPTFTTDGKSGNKKYVMPGNKKYVVGDTENKPPSGGSGQGSGQEGGQGESEDDFEFVLSHDELMDFIFEDLELPDLVKKQMKDVTELQNKRAGFTNVGNPSQLDVVRSLKGAIGRRIGLRRPKKKEIEALEQELLAEEDADKKLVIQEQIDKLKKKQRAIPWLDPFDLRYRNFDVKPQPKTRAVMFCIMDVSASMGETEKDLAKRFFFFLHLFLRRKYDKVEVVFIRHHDEAKEVDEHTFFYERESGGTKVSSALTLTNKIIEERYNLSDWNIYVAQASDGDNISSDNEAVHEEMNKLLSIVQYFAYVEIKSNSYGAYITELWAMYRTLLSSFQNFNMKQIQDVKDIWPVFKELFTKEKA